MALTQQQLQQMDGHVKNAGINLGGAKMSAMDAAVNQKATNQPNFLESLIPAATGTVGAMAGEALGTPFDIFSGPAGTMAGGAIGGGGGQALGQVIQNLLTGNKLGQGVSQAAGEGAAFGAIPGVAETKLGGKVAERLGETALKKAGTKAVGRAGIGAATTGTAQAIQNTDPNAQHGNPLTAALMGGVSGVGSPVVMSRIADALGMLSLGRGGSSLSAINNELGKALTGSKATISKKLAGFYDTAGNDIGPLREKLNLELEKAGNHMTHNEFVDMLENNLSKQGLSLKDPSRLKQVLKNGTPEQKSILTYAKSLADTSGFMSQKYFGENIPKGVNDIKLPLTHWNNVKQMVQRTTPSNLFQSSADTAKAKFAKGTEGQLRTTIEQKSGNPQRVQKLNNLIGKTREIQKHVNNEGIMGAFSHPSVSNVIEALRGVGIPLGGIPAILSGHPGVAAGAGLTAVLSNPAVATRLAQGATSGAMRKQLIPRAIVGLNSTQSAPSAMLQ